jgi:hypothetical protein
MARYRCFMRSVPGPIEQYNGHVDVICETDDWNDVFREAVKALKRGAFPDRNAACWKMDDFNRIG